MTFADLAAGDSLFVDANTLIYHCTIDPKFGSAGLAELGGRNALWGAVPKIGTRMLRMQRMTADFICV